MQHSNQTTAQFIDPLTRDLPPQSRPFMIAALICTALAIGISIFYYLVGQPVIPLLFTLARPSQQLVPKIWILSIPAISLILNLTHLWIIRSVAAMSSTLGKVFALFTVSIQVLLLMALIRIAYITL